MTSPTTTLELPRTLEGRGNFKREWETAVMRATSRQLRELQGLANQFNRMVEQLQMRDLVLRRVTNMLDNYIVAPKDEEDPELFGAYTRARAETKYDSTTVQYALQYFITMTQLILKINSTPRAT